MRIGFIFFFSLVTRLASASVDYSAPKGWTRIPWDKESQVWMHRAANSTEKSVDVITISEFSSAGMKAMTPEEAKVYIVALEKVRSKTHQTFGISDFHVEKYSVDKTSLTLAGNFLDGDRGRMAFHERQIFKNGQVEQIQFSYPQSLSPAPSTTKVQEILDGLRVSN